MNFAGVFSPEQLPDEVVAALEPEFFRHDAERAVGGDDVDVLNAVVASVAAMVRLEGGFAILLIPTLSQKSRQGWGNLGGWPILHGSRRVGNLVTGSEDR